MTISDLIQTLQNFASQDLKGGDAEVILFNRETEETMRVDPDSNVFDFEVLRGDGEVVIEFN